MKYEYKILGLEELSKLTPFDDGQRLWTTGLNSLGSDGWELTAIDMMGNYYFKRLLPCQIEIDTFLSGEKIAIGHK